MQANHLREEDLGHGLRRTWVSERNKVAILTEAISHRQDDGLAADPRKSLNEIKDDISPDRGGN